MSANNMTVDDAVALTTVKKRNFTRQYNACGKVTAFASTNPSIDAASNVKKHQEKLGKAYSE